MGREARQHTRSHHREGGFGAAPARATAPCRGGVVLLAWRGFGPGDPVENDVYLDSSAAGYRQRAYRLVLVVLGVFGLFILRLVDLQIIKGDELRAASERNFMRKESRLASRGSIYDRNGNVLAFDRPSFDLYVTPAEVTDIDALLDGLGEVLGIDALDQERLRERIEHPRGSWRHKAFRVKRDIERTRVARLEALRARIDGLEVQVHHQRTYPEGVSGAHLLGYLGKPNARELREMSDRGIRADSMIGRFGLEKVFDDVLAGRDGYFKHAVDARGSDKVDQNVLKQVDTDVHKAPEPGYDLVLTIDKDVQHILEKALARYDSGAAVVVDIHDGTVKGIVSKPGFDPNIWSGRLTREAKQLIDENPFNPMLDKSVHSYFPGSVYKVVTALAALEEGIVTPETEIDSPGRYEFGNRIFHCHKLSGHGVINFSQAMAASADVYFYKLGEVLQIDALAVYARRFGFGKRTTLRINGESPGLVPTKAWHEEHTDGGYQYGLALSTAIGQGDVRTTPLQMAMAYAAIANGGTVYAPRIVDRIQTRDGQVVSRYEPVVVGDLKASAEHMAALHEALEAAVMNEERGTAKLAQVAYGAVAGKTGTAQVRKIIRNGNRQKVKRFRDRNHAWFAGYAPADAPQIAVVVFLEHGGSGGKDAAPLFSKIVQAYHERVEPVFSTHVLNEPSGQRPSEDKQTVQ